MEYILYHASVKAFTEFKEEYIRKNETDAPFNGFWFTNDKTTSCAWSNPKYLKTCKISLNNPCTWDIVNQITKDKWVSCEEAREKLVHLGYDGIVFTDKPVINESELYLNGETTFKTTKGNIRKLQLTNDGYINMTDKNDEFISDYYHLKDFLDNKEVVVVTFKSDSIEILKEVENEFWN